MLNHYITSSLSFLQCFPKLSRPCMHKKKEIRINVLNIKVKKQNCGSLWLATSTSFAHSVSHNNIIFSYLHNFIKSLCWKVTLSHPNPVCSWYSFTTGNQHKFIFPGQICIFHIGFQQQRIVVYQFIVYRKGGDVNVTLVNLVSMALSLPPPPF